MTTKNYRINVGLNDSDLADLQNIVAQASPYQDELLSAVNGGNQSDIAAVIKKANLGDSGTALQKKLFDITDKLNSSENQQKYSQNVGNIKDEANATDAELESKIGSYQGLQRTGEPLDKTAVQKAISGLLSKGDVNVQKFKGGPGNVSDIENLLSDFVVQNRRLPDVGEFRDLADSKGLPGQTIIGDPTIQNFLNDQNNKNYVALDLGGQPKDYTNDITRIQDLLDTRSTEANKTAAVTQFLQQTPDQLAAARNDFYNQQSASGAQYLRTRLTPKIVQDLNVRGLAEGPDVGSMIAANGDSLQASLEDKIRGLEASDNQFFADSAFRLAQAKINSTEDALNQQIAYERAKVSQNQAQSFQSTEGDIQNEFEQELLKKEQDRELALSQNDIDFNTKTAQDSTINSLTNSLGNSVGSTVATKIATSGAPAAAPAKAVPAATFDSIG